MTHPSIKRFRTILFKTKRKVKLALSKKLYVSFGENCLTDNILERHGLKLLTTPFSHARSNVEYILNLEADDYKDFLNLDHIAYEKLNKSNVPRLKKYNVVHNEYNRLHLNGFEFTHHDVIKDEKARSKIENRVHTLRSFIGRKKFMIFYHHRLSPNTNMDALLQDLTTLKEGYSTSRIRSEAICFTQRIIQSKEDRKLSYSKRDGVHFFLFDTLSIWEGDDDNLLWARCDEDLITEMVDIVKKI